MSEQETSDVGALAALRKPFPKNQISRLPKPTRKDAPKSRCRECGGWHGQPAVHLDYVGHAALTSRLLDVDPTWNWEPLALGSDGLPLLDRHGGMWIKLTVCGHTRLGYGDAGAKSGPDAIKEVIGDALRNAAMRFGAALDLWHKGDLTVDDDGATDNHAEGPASKPDAKPWRGPLNLTALKAKSREIHREITSMEDTEKFMAYLSSDEYRTTVEQLAVDLPQWWHGDGRDGKGLRAAIMERIKDLGIFPGDVPAVDPEEESK